MLVTEDFCHRWRALFPETKEVLQSNSLINFGIKMSTVHAPRLSPPAKDHSPPAFSFFFPFHFPFLFRMKRKTLLLLIGPIRLTTPRWGYMRTFTKLMEILKKNLFPVHLIERVVNSYITVNVPWVPFPLHLYFTFSYFTSAIFLPSLRKRFVTLSQPIAMIWISNYLVFFSFKISNLFGVKDPIPDRLHLRVVYYVSMCGL